MRFSLFSDNFFSV